VWACLAAPWPVRFFTSPSARAVEATLGHMVRQGASGVLLVLKNYTGDGLSFGLAAELASAHIPAFEVRTCMVANDCALDAAHGNRRGLAGIVFVHKCAGAMASALATSDKATTASAFEEVLRVAHQVIRRVRTINVALSGCTIPAVGKPGFTLPAGHMELGLGIHGEPGVCRASLPAADELLADLLRRVCEDAARGAGARVALLLNNLGGVTQLEMGVLTRALLSAARAHGLCVERLLAGAYMTSLDMRGFSVSVLELDDELLSLLDASTSAPGWIVPSRPAEQLDRHPRSQRAQRECRRSDLDRDSHNRRPAHRPTTRHTVRPTSAGGAARRGAHAEGARGSLHGTGSGGWRRGPRTQSGARRRLHPDRSQLAAVRSACGCATHARRAPGSRARR